MFSKVLFMSSLSLKFSKATNLFEISIWYCFLTSSSLSFLRLNLSPSEFCAAFLLTANLSLTLATTRQWSVSQSAPLQLCTSSILECHLLSINMWSLWLWVFPSGEVRVYLRIFLLWKHCALNSQIFDVAKFIILITLSLLTWCKLSFSTVGLKIFSHPLFALKSPGRIFIWCSGKSSKICSNSSQKLSF